MGTSTDGAEDKVHQPSTPIDRMAQSPAAGALGEKGTTLEGIDCDKTAKHAERATFEEFKALTSRVEEGEDNVGMITSDKTVLTYYPSRFC